MAVNCAAIPGELMESELFGHEPGAFTGAAKRHLGYAERAGEGTLFLDEIGELAMPLQAKLLRLLEDRHFHRVGGEAPVPFEARLVTATNADLNALMAAKRFRDDLYYRINVVEVRIPPLRERAEDIPWLMGQLFERLAAERDPALRGISALAEQAALLHAWPGNVRELRNRMERAIALNLGGTISPQDLFPEKKNCRPPRRRPHRALCRMRGRRPKNSRSHSRLLRTRGRSARPPKRSVFRGRRSGRK
jgi:DNA-binding NtrC family response regulator